MVWYAWNHFGVMEDYGKVSHDQRCRNILYLNILTINEWKVFIFSFVKKTIHLVFVPISSGSIHFDFHFGVGINTNVLA